MRAILMLALFSISCAALCADKYPNPRSHIENDYLDEVIAKAISGDFDASFWLSEYFIDGVSDALEGSFWLKLSAEQGSCMAVREYLRFAKNQYGNEVAERARLRYLRRECRQQ